jgi:hypothetical protein
MGSAVEGDSSVVVDRSDGVEDEMLMGPRLDFAATL